MSAIVSSTIVFVKKTSGLKVKITINHLVVLQSLFTVEILNIINRLVD